MACQVKRNFFTVVVHNVESSQKLMKNLENKFTKYS